MAATWIDFIADKLVSLLEFFGILLRVPNSIMGLTVLAWGNSMADLSANVTMARKGLANMAITACFAGPIFNILVGLGAGFGVLRSVTKTDINYVTLTPSITTGFVFCFINCGLLCWFRDWLSIRGSYRQDMDMPLLFFTLHILPRPCYYSFCCKCKHEQIVQYEGIIYLLICIYLAE